MQPLAAHAGAGLGERLLEILGHDDFLGTVGGRDIVPGRYAVAPPELARDTPVLDILEPVAVCGLVLLGHKAYDVVHDRSERDVGKVLHVDKPLQRQTRLDGSLGALAQADIVGIVFDALEQAGLGEILGDGLAALKAIHAHIHAGSLGDGGVVVEYVDGLEMVILAQHVVVFVVGWGHLEATRTKLDVDVAVFDHRHHAAHQRHHHAVALEPLVFGVLGVDTHGRVAHDGLGACGGYQSVAAAVGIAVYHLALGAGLAGHVVVGQIVPQIVELALLGLKEYLVVADGGEIDGVPVDHAQAAVDEALVVKVAEYLYHALRAGGVHGEGRAVPVARGAELAQLLQDDAAVEAGPLPCVLQKLLAGQVGLLDALGGELGDDLGLGRDGCMVGAGHPQGVHAHHAGAAHQDILDSIVEHMAHVQHAGDIGRRYHYRIGRAGIGDGAEELVLHPIGIPFVLHLGRTVYSGQFFHVV